MKNIKTSIFALGITLLISGILFGIMPSDKVSAIIPVECPDGTTVNAANADAAKTACEDRQKPSETPKSNLPTLPTRSVDGTDTCGAGDEAVKTSIDFGCKGKDNPIYDLLFALIRFLTVGVGIVLIISTIITGIQYTLSRGDPATVVKAKTRLFNIFMALLLYIFSFALLNYLVPGGLLGG